MENEFRKLLLQALKEKSSDIHLTLKDHLLKVEFRTIKGLKKYRGPDISEKLMDYLKYLSHMDLLNTLQPQTGSFKFLLNQKEYYLRFACLSSGNTESGVLRILNPIHPLSIKSLFVKPYELAEIKRLLHLSTGLVIISGSTGSGKSTTLFTCLKECVHQKIYSIEDPIEHLYPEILQLQVNRQRKFGFEEAIKQVLRHDPNIVVIGEIRDEIEAKTAVRCALSGHLVISTIHAISAVKTISRLVNLGVKEDELHQVLEAVVYQKLTIHPISGQRTAVYEILTRSSDESDYRLLVQSDKKISSKTDKSEKNTILPIKDD